MKKLLVLCSLLLLTPVSPVSADIKPTTQTETDNYVAGYEDGVQEAARLLTDYEGHPPVELRTLAEYHYNRAYLFYYAGQRTAAVYFQGRSDGVLSKAD